MHVSMGAIAPDESAALTPVKWMVRLKAVGMRVIKRKTQPRAKIKWLLSWDLSHEL